jgi:hypothetical protein
LSISPRNYVSDDLAGCPVFAGLAAGSAHNSRSTGSAAICSTAASAAS